MWLILCDDLDVSARWVYEELRRRSLATQFVPASVFSRAVRWVHGVGPNGAYADITLADGRRISSAEVGGTLNRMLGLWPPDEYFSSPDSDYATQELLSMYVSLLQSLPAPILNPPTALGLSGRMRYPADWFVLAAEAGFETESYIMSTRNGFGTANGRNIAPAAASLWHKSIVLGDRVFGDPLSEPLAEAACRLARLAGVSVLGLNLLIHGDKAARFESADLYPDLRAGGTALIDYLAELRSK
jgi:hypothetical protein